MEYATLDIFVVEGPTLANQEMVELLVTSALLDIIVLREQVNQSAVHQDITRI